MMQRYLSAAVLMVCAASAGAQQPDRAPTRGSSVMWGAVGIYNTRNTMRVSGQLDVAADREIAGDVAVINGPVTVSGRVTGTLAAINADVRLERGASIGGDLIVVGGTLTRDDSARVEGEVRSQAEILMYRFEGETLVPEERPFDWRPRWHHSGMEDRGESYTDLLFIAARSYNRVEGLAGAIGPRFRRPTNWGRVQVEALGIVRTAEPMQWDRNTIGHDFRADLRLGVRNGLTLGARAFDVVEAVEPWQLSDNEAGLAAAVLHRDLRDLYGRHGGEGSIGGRLGEEVALSLALGSERWRSTDARDPFSFFRDGDAWRVNPRVDEGKVDLASIRLNIDTRRKLRSAWLSGWYVRGDIERGRGTIARDLGPLPGIPTPEDVSYTRGFIDARRYLQVAPGVEFNLRLVTAGWLGGDRLPLQKRFSVGGPGSLEGYDFRRSTYDTDVFTCGGIAERAGRPAQCDRIALAQVEFRRDFDIPWARTDREDHWWRPGLNTRGAWVLFSDFGRGWTTEGSTPGIQHRRGLPPLSSFRTDIGMGLDFGGIGIYLAKATSTGREPMNVIVRLGRRF